MGGSNGSVLTTASLVGDVNTQPENQLAVGPLCSLLLSYYRSGALVASSVLIAAAALVTHGELRARRQRRRRAELLPRLVGLDEDTALAEVVRAGLVASVFG